MDWLLGLFGWKRTKKTPPLKSEFVRVSTFPFGVALYGEYGEKSVFHYSRAENGHCNPTWWKKIKNGDCLIQELEHGRKMIEMKALCFGEK